jgi:hypothetical protein
MSSLIDNHGTTIQGLGILFIRTPRASRPSVMSTEVLIEAFNAQQVYDDIPDFDAFVPFGLGDDDGDVFAVKSSPGTLTQDGKGGMWWLPFNAATSSLGPLTQNGEGDMRGVPFNTATSSLGTLTQNGEGDILGSPFNTATARALRLFSYTSPPQTSPPQTDTNFGVPLRLNDPNPPASPSSLAEWMQAQKPLPMTTPERRLDAIVGDLSLSSFLTPHVSAAPRAPWSTPFASSPVPPTPPHPFAQTPSPRPTHVLIPRTGMETMSRLQKVITKVMPPPAMSSVPPGVLGTRSPEDLSLPSLPSPTIVPFPVDVLVGDATHERNILCV